MISKEYGKFHLTCDVCGEQEDTIFEDFWEALTFKREYEWKTQKHGGEWEDICPLCSREY